MEHNLEELKYPIGKYEQVKSFTEDDIRQWLSVLTALPSWLDACIENLDEHQLNTPYRAGGWTVNQVIHHLADSHMNAYIRLKLSLTESNPIVKPYKEELWAELADNTAVPVNVSITLLHSLHLRLVAVMERMTPDDWNRSYHHPQHNRDIPLWELAALYAWHSRHHMEHIIRLRERMAW